LAAAVQYPDCCSASLQLVRGFWFAVRGETRHTNQALDRWTEIWEMEGYTMIQLLKNLHKEESGQDIIEYILIAAFITAGVIVTIGQVATKVASYWTSLNTLLT
jgi:Flp pilus assembly pilin Flp